MVRNLGKDVIMYTEDEMPESHTGRKEIGKYAVWSLSSAKPRFDVEQLRDNNLETYWQSDGPAPHLINIQFHKKVTVDEISLYLNYKSDESYTPCQLTMRAGSTYHDLQDIKTWEFQEPQGWLSFMLSKATGKQVRANFFQIVILANHQSGRDTHIRQIRVYGPQEEDGSGFGLPNFKTPELYTFTTIR